MDPASLHGLALVLLASAALSAPWLIASGLGSHRRSFYTASPETRAAASRALDHYGSWEALEAAAEVGEDGVFRIKAPRDPEQP